MKKTTFIALLFSSLLFTGCNSDNNKPSQKTPETKELESSQKISELESSGLIPKLERGPTLAGIDNDKNGIRDDIDEYIDNNYIEQPQRKAVEQSAKALQTLLLANKDNINSLKNANIKLSEAIYCVFLTFNDENSLKTPEKVSHEIESITTNTKERLLSYLTVMKKLDGTSWSIPNGNTCE